MAQSSGHKSRDQWGSQTEFILACLGYAVGLGNVWRFPYLCGRNGGATFLIPYFVMLMFAGFPVFYMELSLGQYGQLSPVLLFDKMAPAFAGLGACMLLAQTYIGLYYNMIIAWSLFYLGNTLRSPLQWSHCSNDFNTFRCLDAQLNESCFNDNKTYLQGKCLTSQDLQDPTLATQIQNNWQTAIEESIKNKTERELYYQNSIHLSTTQMISEIFNKSAAIPTKEYLYIRALGLSKGLEYYGTPRWELVICLLAAWVLMFFCLMGGTKSIGKVVYFTATFPYLILFILLIRGCTLDKGVIEGLNFFIFKPNMTKLAEPAVWRDAATQIFFSLSLGAGGLTTIASFNKFHNNFFRDTLIVVLGNCATSIFAGFVIFPVVGFIAATLGQNVSEVAKGGIGLAFQVYPDAINQMAMPQLWAFLFFFMLVLLGIDSELVLMETPITGILDTWPSLRKTNKKMLVVGAICTGMFLFGIVFTCPGGPYLLSLFDSYCGGWPQVIGCTIEVMFVMWVYGVRNFISDVRLMLGKPPNMYYKILGYPINPYWVTNWVVITPLLLLAVLIFNLVKFKQSEYGSDYVYPVWADVVGWLMTLSCIICIPAVGIYKVVRAHQAGVLIKSLFRPKPDWGPGDTSVKNNHQLPDVVKPTTISRGVTGIENNGHSHGSAFNYKY